MILLQVDSTKLLDTGSFRDNFFWPGLLVLTITIIGLIWNFFIRKKVKSKIHFDESYIGVLGGSEYTILKITINNKTTTPINNLRFETVPKYELKKNLTKPTVGRREIRDGSDSMVLPFVYDILKNVIDPTKQQIVEAEHPREGLIIIESGGNEVQKLIVCYWDKKEELKVNYNNLQRRAL